MYDPEAPLVFDVFPPQPSSGQGYAEIAYGAIPPANTRVSGVDLSPGLTATINISDIYVNDLVNYILYRVHLVDAHDSANAALAATYLQAFLNGIQMRDQRKAMNNPMARTN